MPTLRCRCDAHISLHALPCTVGSWVIREVDFDAICERLLVAGASAEQLESAVWKDVLGYRNPAIRWACVCPTCSRLYLFAKGDSEPVAIWRLESGSAELLLDRKGADAST